MSPHDDGGRRALQVTMAALAAIPFASGLAGMLLGPSTLPGDDSQVMASLDSEYRFTSAIWFALGPLIWWATPRVERESTVLRVAVAPVFLGGFARLRSWRSVGRPHPIFVGATALELVGMPVVVVWQHRVAKLAAAAAAAAR